MTLNFEFALIQRKSSGKSDTPVGGIRQTANPKACGIPFDFVEEQHWRLGDEFCSRLHQRADFGIPVRPFNDSIVTDLLRFFYESAKVVVGKFRPGWLSPNES